jgi:aminoglycoside phosphotransferase (APT) family kinase protein
MSALAGSKVPVPRMCAYCADEQLIGTQFYVMSFVEGRLFKDVTLRALPEEARFAVYSDMCRYARDTTHHFSLSARTLPTALHHQHEWA